MLLANDLLRKYGVITMILLSLFPKHFSLYIKRYSHQKKREYFPLDRMSLDSSHELRGRKMFPFDKSTCLK